MNLTWHPWASVSEGSSTPGAPVTAVPWGDRFALFIADPNGGIYTTGGDPQAGFGPWASVSEGRSTPGAPVTAILWRFEFPVGERLAVFIADPNGGITWQGGAGPWASVSEGRSKPGAPVTALPWGNRIALFIADPNGGIYTTFSRFDPPEGPVGLEVSNVADRKISVTWIDQSNDEDRFRVRFRGTRRDFADHTGTLSASRDEVSATLSGLRSDYEYTISVVSFNSAGDSRSSNEVRAKTPARHISVSKEGVGASSVFIVTGSSFTPNSLVVIRFTDVLLNQLQFPETAGGDGKFVSRHGVACVSGKTLTITAFEDADPTGTFADVIVTTCP